jgi:hypothetical protein
LLLRRVDKLKFVLQGFAELFEDVIASEGLTDEVGHGLLLIRPDMSLC